MQARSSDKQEAINQAWHCVMHLRELCTYVYNWNTLYKERENFSFVHSNNFSFTEFPLRKVYSEDEIVSERRGKKS